MPSAACATRWHAGCMRDRRAMVVSAFQRGHLASQNAEERQIEAVDALRIRDAVRRRAMIAAHERSPSGAA